MDLQDIELGARVCAALMAENGSDQARYFLRLQRQSKIARAKNVYRRRFGWLGWEEGRIDTWNRDIVIYPRWYEDARQLAEHLWLRLQRRCISCRMRGVHKMDCYHSWTIRDDLRALRLWPRKREILWPTSTTVLPAARWTQR